jgi:hypothetical protein
VDVDQAAENEGFGSLGVLPFFEDDDDAIGSLHTACILFTPLTHTVDAGFIEWVVDDTELNPTVGASQEISGDDLPLPITAISLTPLLPVGLGCSRRSEHHGNLRSRR